MEENKPEPEKPKSDPKAGDEDSEEVSSYDPWKEARKDAKVEPPDMDSYAKAVATDFT